MRIKDLKKEVKANIPDLSDKISAMTDWQSIALNSVETNKKINQAVKKPIKKSWSFAFAAIAAVLVMAIVLPLSLKTGKPSQIPNIATYEVVFSVNPAVKFTVDKNDKVVKKTGLNDDGVKFLYGTNYEGKSIDEVTEMLCNEFNSLGFFINNKVVNISAYSIVDHEKLNDKQSEISKKIREVLSSEIEVSFMDDDVLDDFLKYNPQETINSFIEELKNELRPLITEKIEKIEAILSALEQSSYKKYEIVKLDDKITELISEYCAKYKFALNFNPQFTTGKKINDFKEDLKDLKEELEECLEELDEKIDDDYDDILEDLFEIIKEGIFGADD